MKRMSYFTETVTVFIGFILHIHLIFMTRKLGTSNPYIEGNFKFPILRQPLSQFDCIYLINDTDNEENLELDRIEIADLLLALGFKTP